MEAVAAANPYYILVQCHAGEEKIKKMIEETYGNNAVCNSLDAVKNNMVCYMSKLLFHNSPNHRFAEALKKLSEFCLLERYSLSPDEENKVLDFLR